MSKEIASDEERREFCNVFLEHLCEEMNAYGNRYNLLQADGAYIACKFLEGVLLVDEDITPEIVVGLLNGLRDMIVEKKSGKRSS